MKKRSLLIILFLLVGILPVFGKKMDVSAKVIYTTNAKVNAGAEKIIKSCTTEDMTPEQKLRQVYLYLVKHMRYSYRTGKTRIKVTSKDIQETRLKASMLSADNGGGVTYSSRFKKRYKNLLTLQGTCYGQSMVLGILANHLGFPAKLCKGKYVTAGGKRSSHYWLCITMSGQKKYFDVQIANYYWKKSHKMSTVDKYYMKNKSDKVWRKHHRG